MSGDTDKAKISDNQDEDKKSGTGDGQTTEDESSQDSKGESVQTEAQGNSVADEPSGDAKSTTANGKDDDGPADDSKDEKGAKAEDCKKEENGETHDEDDKEDVKENDKGAKKLAPKKKPKKEDTEEEEEDEEEEEEEDEEGEEGDEEDEQKPKDKVKKPVKKLKDGEEEGDDEEEGEEEGEEEEEEEEEEEAPKPKPKKEPTEPPVPLPAGKGFPLGHISNVEVSLSRFKTQDQKILHQYLYGQLCLDRNVKRNIKKFKGYEWAIGSTEYKAKLEETAKMEPKQLRTMCEMLDLDKKGGPSELAARLVGFLQQPVANSPHARGVARAAAPAHATPGGRPRRTAAAKIHNRGYSDEEYESDPETKVKGPKQPKDGSEDSDGSFNPSGSEADSDFDPEGGEGVSGVARKRKSSGRRPSSKGKRGRKSKGKKKGGSRGRGRRARSDSEDESDKSESDSEADSGSDGDESDEPKSKRGRPAGSVSKGRKGAVAKASAKATPAKRKAPTPTGKKKAGSKPVGRPAKKGKRASSDESGDGEEGSEEEEEEGSDEEESGEESDTPADKKAKRPPTDEEIKKYVKQILEGANLEQITMKTVCKQVYSHYPDFDLAHKKDFIKATVKSGSFNPSGSEADSDFDPEGERKSKGKKKVSEEDEEEQESEGDGEEGDYEEGGDEEGGDEEGNEEAGEEEKEEEAEVVPKFMPKKEPTELPVPQIATKFFSLGNISNVGESLSRFKTQDQKILHQYLYGQLCPDRYVTENIKKFKGFQWTFNSTEYKAKLMETARMEPRHLRAMCDMLDLQNNGGPSELATRLVGFLQQPGASFHEVSRRPLVKTDNRGAADVHGPRRTRSHSPPSVTHRDEEYESDPDTKAIDSKNGSQDSDSSTKSSGSEASDAGSEGEDVIGTETREAEAKVIPDRQRPPPKNKKNPRDMLVRSTKGEKASSEESYEGEESSEEEEEEEERSDEEESGEETDTPADKKAKRPPTDEEIKKCVRQILEGANLEQITMKTLCKQVFSHYPDYDLEHKKEFIKSAVKSLL